MLEAKVDLGVAAGEITEAMSAVIQLTDRTLLIKPVAELATTDTLTFVTPFATPATLRAGVRGRFRPRRYRDQALPHSHHRICRPTHPADTLVDEAPAPHAA